MTTQSLFVVEPLTDYPQREQVIAAAAANAKAVDVNHESPFAVLRALGSDGLLALGLDGSLVQQAAVVHDLATECTATAFSLWAHRSSIEYLNATGRELPEGLVNGTEPGSTAMAPAFKAAAGIGDIPVTLTRSTSGNGWVLNGVIPWASNLYPEGWVVLPALRSTPDDSTAETNDDDARPVILVVRTSQEGVSVRPLQDLMALDSTASGILKFQDAPVSEEAILTEDVPAFLEAVRGPFLLLQAAFCVGLSGAALESADAALSGVSEVFRPDRDTVVAEYNRVRSTLLRYLDTPRDLPFRDVAQLRLDAALLTGEATRLEAKVVGGKGYALRSATARRAREAAFLPVQSPTESHLRHVLAQFQAQEGNA
ncbi:acyl-CoA dehydrogenase family protein [Kocuria sp.]|uniref:acyl-CoA dehydrogenase family protein n=1 Tax=Kocuria sp. TaxID=1871328 RepID=UPI0026E079F4|nr:acyl-CoA dehydrogenase family protein [Kocuria sp.]MDO5617877.1 acyl-CoA dehydrogenase family protein [Kocuria sp.]